MMIPRLASFLFPYSHLDIANIQTQRFRNRRKTERCPAGPVGTRAHPRPLSLCLSATARYSLQSTELRKPARLGKGRTARPRNRRRRG
jgi:hypothetical protein